MSHALNQRLKFDDRQLVPREKPKNTGINNLLNIGLNSMKILMIAPTPFFSDRGCHVRIYEEAKHLASMGNNVTICTYHIGNDIPGLDIRRIINIPWYNKASAGPSIHKIYLDLLLLLKSILATHQTKPDVIHAYLHEGVLIGKICSLIFRIPLVFDVQGEFTSEIRAHKFLHRYPFLQNVIYRIFSFVEWWSYKVPDALLVNSSFMSNRLQKNNGIRKNKIFVVPDAAGLPNENSSNKTQNLAERLRIPTNKKIVVYLGLLTEYQGIDLLLQVIKSMTEKREDVHFLIMGFPSEEKYQKIAQDLKISEYITFTGRVPYWEIYDYLALGTIAVSPKLLDLGGEANIKLYNYMAAGLPTVAFDYIVNREILDNLGVYAIPGDRISFENCITNLLDDNGLRLTILSKLKKLNLNAYSWCSSINQLLQAYLYVKRNQ